MSKDAAPQAGYQQAKGRLVDWLRRRVPEDLRWVTPLRAELEGLASQLIATADRAEFGPGAMSLEQEFDGLPGESGAVPVKSAIWGMRELAVRASKAAEQLPNPRERNSIPRAALIFLHLRARHGLPIAVHDTSPAVLEFEDLLAQARAVKGTDSVVKYLKDARKLFDPHMPPTEFLDVY